MQIPVIAAMVTVFAWSVVMVAMGQAAGIAALAPALGLAVQQVVAASRSRSGPAAEQRAVGRPGEGAGNS